MLNLARAALLPNIRILVCDEPTSNIDMATDRRLQQVDLYVRVLRVVYTVAITRHALGGIPPPHLPEAIRQSP